MKLKYLLIVAGAAPALFGGHPTAPKPSLKTDTLTVVVRHEGLNTEFGETVVSSTENTSPTKPEPAELWTDFQSFLDWFTRVVLPWLVAFFTSGGAGILIFKIAQMVANQLKVKKVVSESTEELNALREKYSKTMEAIRSRDELLARLIETVLNAKTRDELLLLFKSLPSPADLEASKVTEKIKLKVKKKKAEVNYDATVAH